MSLTDETFDQVVIAQHKRFIRTGAELMRKMHDPCGRKCCPYCIWIKVGRMTSRPDPSEPNTLNQEGKR